MLIDLAQLHLDGRKPLGKGGQGYIYEIDAGSARASGWSGPTVAKRYKHELAPPALQNLLERVRWRSSLAAPARAELDRVAAWPLMAIADRGALAGIVMVDQRPRYGAQIKLPSGLSEPVLTSLEHLLEERPGYLRERFAVSCDQRMRAMLAERLAGALALLHKHAIVAGDISHTNVLMSLSPPHHVTLIDCDSMTFRGKST